MNGSTPWHFWYVPMRFEMRLECVPASLRARPVGLIELASRRTAGGGAAEQCAETRWILGRPARAQDSPKRRPG